MEELYYYFRQLPDFIQIEVAGHIGSTHGLSLFQLTSRYLAATDYWIVGKRSNYQPLPNRDEIFGIGPLSKQEIEGLKALVDSQMGIITKNPASASRLSNLTSESIRYLVQFRSNVLPIHSKAQATEQRRQAEEAARHLAQRQAEEAARQLVERQNEEAARLLAQQKAQEAQRRLAQHRAEEVARQLAQRQQDEIAMQLARRHAEEVALSVMRPQMMESAVQQMLGRTRQMFVEANKLVAPQPLEVALFVLPGPKVISHVIDQELKSVEHEIRLAIADFLQNGQTTIPVVEEFSAMLYAFEKNGFHIPPDFHSL